MADNIYSVIKASGCFIPPGIIKNSDFLSNVFYDAEGKILGVPNEEIISKFKKITNISEEKTSGKSICNFRYGIFCRFQMQ